MNRFVIVSLFIVAPRLVVAQPSLDVPKPTINFTADVQVIDEVTQTNLTWNTSPAAQSCVASGDSLWTGEKAGNGTQSLPATTGSHMYQLACTWPGNGKTTLSWTPATVNTDGSVYDNPSSVRIKYMMGTGTDDSLLVENACSKNLFPCIDVPIPATETVIQQLDPGHWIFVAYSVNTLGQFSPPSNPATKDVVADANITQQATITIGPPPGPPSSFSAN